MHIRLCLHVSDMMVHQHTCDTGDTLVCYEVPYRSVPMGKAGQAYEMSIFDASGRIKTRDLVQRRGSPAQGCRVPEPRRYPVDTRMRYVLPQAL